MGNVTEQIALKKRLNCKSFAWFMEEVAYDVLDKYPELPPNLHWGEVSFSIFYWLLIIKLSLQIAPESSRETVFRYYGPRTPKFDGNFVLSRIW